MSDETDKEVKFESLTFHFASRCLFLDVCRNFGFSLFRTFAVLPELPQFSLQFSSPSTLFALLFLSEFDLFEFAVELVR
jgi:hypothetical protein